MRRADPSSRKVLPSVCVCHWEWSGVTITLCIYNEEGEEMRLRKERESRAELHAWRLLQRVRPVQRVLRCQFRCSCFEDNTCDYIALFSLKISIRINNSPTPYVTYYQKQLCAPTKYIYICIHVYKTICTPTFWHSTHTLQGATNETFII